MGLNSVVRNLTQGSWCHVSYKGIHTVLTGGYAENLTMALLNARLLRGLPGGVKISENKSPWYDSSQRWKIWMESQARWCIHAWPHHSQGWGQSGLNSVLDPASKERRGEAWWYMPLIPAFGRQRQEDLCMFCARPDLYIEFQDS